MGILFVVITIVWIVFVKYIGERRCSGNNRYAIIYPDSDSDEESGFKNGQDGD